MPARTFHKTLLLGALLIGVASAVGVLLYERRSGLGDQRPEEFEASGWSEQAIAEPGRVERSQDVTAPESEQGRAATSRRVRVMDPNGKPIVDASAAWIPFLPEWMRTAGSWPDMDWSELRKRSLAFRSSDDGSFAFDAIRPIDSGTGSVLWITHTDYVAKKVVLPPDEAGDPFPEFVILSPAGRLTARVIGPDGKAADRATVVQIFDMSRLDPGTMGDLDLDSRRVARWETTTDLEGKALLFPLPSNQSILATAGGLVSEPWFGSQPAEVKLELRPCFSAGGAVFPDPPAPVGSGMAVRWVVQRGNDLYLLDRIGVRADGTWGRERLPVVPADAYLFQLEGAGFAMEQVRMDPAKPGERVTIDFRPGPGVDVTIHVVGDQDQDLEGATVIANWNLDGTWRKVERRTGKDGLARYRNCYPGMLWVRARCPGFAGRLVESIDVTKPLAEPILVKLDRAGKIRGQVVHADEPVSDFTLYFWQKNPNAYNKVPIIDRPGGDFEIDQAPVGETVIMATTESWPRSEPKTVFVSAEQPAEVLLEMPDALTGRGQVVDALTNEPILEARVQLFSNYERINMSPWGNPVQVDSRGYFEIAGFVKGRNAITVSAPGYASSGIGRIFVSGEAIDFGLIGLFKTQAVEVQLVADRPVDFSRYTGDLTGSVMIDRKPFSPDGRLRFEALDPNVYNLRVVSPEYSSHNEQFVLTPGSDVQLTVPVDARHLHVEVIPRPGEMILHNSFLRVTFKNRVGHPLEQSYPIFADGNVDVTRVEGDRITLQVEDPDLVILAVEQVVLRDDGPTSVTIRLGETARRFRVLDASRTPVANIRLILTDPGLASAWIQDLQTDAEGKCSIRGLALEKIQVLLYHPTFGMQPSIPVDFSEHGSGPIELIFAPDLSLKVKLIERDTPVPAMSVEATDHQGVSWGLGITTSDADGVAVWGPVSRGDFIVEVHHPGYWNMNHPVHLDREGPPVPLQVRRLGGAEFTVKNNYGNPMPGASVDLYSVEQKAWVSDWIDAGRVTYPAGGMITNAEGRLRVNGLPNGEFRWRVTPPGEEHREGSVVIPPHAIASVDVH